MDGKFVMDIRDFTVSVSGSTAPVGIVLFGVSYCTLIWFLNFSFSYLSLLPLSNLCLYLWYRKVSLTLKGFSIC